MIDHLSFARDLCLECGEIIKDGFYKDKSIQAKDVADFVTEYDLSIESLVHDRIAHTFPDYKFIGEETAAKEAKYFLTADPTWIVDPIDGTNNFIARFPFCCISLALYVNKECLVAVIFNPILNMLYTAEKGKGAFLNNNKIRVSPSKDLMSSIVISGWGSDRNEKNVLIKADNQRKILESCRGIRSIGSAALSMCMVAGGQADAYIEQGINCWDMAAGALIVTEAGGVLANPDGSDFDLMTHGVLCASHKSYTDHIASLITHINY